MYYLNSRYYDPVIFRFINADDSIAGVGGTMLGYNMYVYCFNNPVNMDDNDGNWPKFVRKVANSVKNVAKKTVGIIKKVVKQINRVKTTVKSVVNNIANKCIGKVIDKYKKDTKGLSYESNGPRLGAKIRNSYEVYCPVEMYIYVNSHRGDEVEGSTSGIVFEWEVHNLAYAAGTVFEEIGFSDLGANLKNRGKDVDFGNTIYDDTHGGASVLMWNLYDSLYGPISIYDHYIELFE